MAITVLNKGNVPIGPFTRAQVAEKLQTGEFSPDDLAHVEGLSQWTPLRDVLAKVDGTMTLPPLPGFIPPPVVQATPSAYSYAATMQPPGHLVYAGFWIRVLAHLLDNLIVSVPFIAVWLVVAMVFVGAGVFTPFMLTNQQSQQANPVLVTSIAVTIIMLYLSLILGRFLVVWLYHAILESGPHQATWGKRILGLKVTSMTGQRITFWHATGRYFSIFITNMTMGIGYFMVAFTDRKQALHDMIASTLVVVVKE